MLLDSDNFHLASCDLSGRFALTSRSHQAALVACQHAPKDGHRTFLRLCMRTAKADQSLRTMLSSGQGAEVRAQQAVYLVSQHTGIAIFAEPPSLTRHEGVVIKPLTDKSLSFETCLIMRADEDSRAVNEFGRAFLKKYSPHRVAAKQMELPLPA